MTEPIAALAQNTVADITAASIFSPGQPDTATISASLLLTKPVAAQVLLETLQLQGMTDVSIDVNDTLATIRGQLALTPAGDDRFRLGLSVPFEPVSLIKNGDFSLIALLPRPGAYPDGPVYEVELVSYTDDPRPVIHGVGHTVPIGQRISLSWQGRMDPELDVEYLLRRLVG